MSEQLPRRAGTAECPFCGCETHLGENKKHHLYIYCRAVDDGGCNMSTQARSKKADALLVKYAKKWIRPEDRARFGGVEKTPAKEPEKTPSPASVKEAPKPPARGDRAGPGFGIF